MRYFAYGSNMSMDQMAERCPGAELVGPARLEGYKLGFTRFSERWNAGVADVIVSEGSVVWGLLFAVTDDHIASLDRYEGHPNHYTRIAVTVMASNEIAACTYSVTNKVDFVRPANAYLAVMIAAAEAHAFPDAYLTSLRSLGTST